MFESICYESNRKHRYSLITEKKKKKQLLPVLEYWKLKMFYILLNSILMFYILLNSILNCEFDVHFPIFENR